MKLTAADRKIIRERNSRRADRAARALASEDYDEPQDLIADLCHLLAKRKATITQIRGTLQLGLDHYRAELAEP
jgi:hypothetical protein